MIVILQVIILGIIEGLSEFLPISSTGHLILAQEVIGFQDYKELFTVVIQVGAIAAVIWYYRQDLISKTVGLFRKQPSALNFWKILVIGTAPALLIGFLLESYMDRIAVPGVIAVSLIVGGVVLWLVDHRRVAVSSQIQPKIEKISFKQAIIVGFSQCVALIPGVSRSGATIVGGLTTGLDRPTATAFSFYLSIPVLILASGYKLLKYDGGVSQIDGGWSSIIIGMIVSFIVALLAISWLLKYVSRHNFTLFAYYRIALGIAILIVVGL